MGESTNIVVTASDWDKNFDAVSLLYLQYFQ